MINENGGKMPDAVGIPEEQLRKAARSAVCKINIDSDLRLAMTGTIRQFIGGASRQVRPPRVPQARPCRHQGAGQAQADRRPGLRRQGLIPSVSLQEKASFDAFSFLPPGPGPWRLKAGR